MNPWLLLAFAIAGEVIATTSLRFSQGFTRPVPVVFVVFGYGFAIWLQSLVLKQLPLGTVYAVWSGVGTAITALLGVWLFREALTPAVAIGILLIIGGVIVLNTATIAR